MLPEKNNTLEYNQYINSNKILYISYADTDVRSDVFANNPEVSSTKKIG